MAGYIGAKQGVTQVDGYNRAEADAEFVQVTGDTMTGALAVNGNLTVDTNTLFVDAANNRVGVGTSSPDTLLHVGTTGAKFRLGETASDQYLDVYRDIPTGNIFYNAAQPTFGAHVWQTAGTERMRIDSSGRVGIGTSSPAGRLHVRHDVVTGKYVFQSTDQRLTLGTYWESGVGQYAFINSSTDNENIAQPLLFQTGGVERARIDSSGRLGVGTTAPNGRITAAPVSGNNPNTNLNGFSLTTFGGYGGGIAMIDSGNPNSGTGYGIWVDDAGNDFNIAQGSTSSGVTGGVYINNNAGSWSSRSDERDKTNLEPITDAASKVQSLRAVIGEYIWAEGVRHPFLIAQDVQAVLPEAVNIANKSAPEEEQRLGMSYTDMVPLLTAALQEALTKIDALEARIVTLEGGAA